MKPTQRLISALALVATLGGLTACGPEDPYGDSTGGSSASAQPSKKPSPSEGSTDEAGGPGDCGAPPKLPAGHKMVEPAAPPSKGSLSAKDAKPVCTPNGWIYHGQGKAKYYLFARDVKADLATGSGSTKSVPVGELWMHAGDCMTNPSAVKAPYSCSGNIYDITLDSEGNVNSIKEIWHP
ncbi:hypothetical protein DY245_32785 [Streptomyces inhibens]|uniref:Uncharacterized protein n=1 Tax=Streptomyces inhibens TaxID=2293571 RepID=A0A371PVC3_STRIH|nr:hypothetical protein [Streptomyces inhibens]REK86426.1 hypothetical protein DY245_32785 [Streptomyces inhibens]